MLICVFTIMCTWKCTEHEWVVGTWEVGGARRRSRTGGPGRHPGLQQHPLHVRGAPDTGQVRTAQGIPLHHRETSQILPRSSILVRVSVKVVPMDRDSPWPNFNQAPLSPLPNQARTQASLSVPVDSILSKNPAKFV